MIWNDSLDSSLPIFYNLSGLLNSISYNVTNSTSSDITSQTITTDLGGTLSVTYALSQNMNTQISVSKITTPPSFSQNSTNSTFAGMNALHSLYLQGSINLSGYIFSFDNGTGVFVNESWVSLSGISNWSNVTKSINSIIGATMRWIVYTNDTNNNWNQSVTYTYLTTDGNPPTSSLNLTSGGREAGTDINHLVYWQDNVNLSGYIFSFDNGTGIFINDSFVSMIGAANWSNVTKKITSTVGATIQWTVFANDTNNNWNQSLIYSYITNDVTPPTYTNLLLNNTSPKKNESVLFGALWVDALSVLSHYIFSWNNSGSWVNDTPITFVGNWSYQYQGTYNSSVVGSLDFDSWNYTNYSKIGSAKSALWFINDSVAGATNLTIPNSCFSQSILQVQTFNHGSIGAFSEYRCFNGFSYISLLHESFATLYNEGIFWGVGQYSTITKQAIASKNTRVDWLIYANDSYGNLNVTIEKNFTVANTPPVVTASIFPSPATNLDNLNCTENYYDVDSDLESSHWFKWYVNGILSSFTSQNLSVGNYTSNDTVICSIRAFDGTDNSTWSNSSPLTVGDKVPPVLHDDFLSASSGYTNNILNIYVNATELNYIEWVYAEIQDPNQVKTNLTMTQESHVGSEYKFNVSYTPQTAGTYHFKFYARDGSGNVGNLTSTLTYTASVYVAPVVQNNNGDGGVILAQNYTGIAIYPLHAELSVFSLGEQAISVRVKNAQTNEVHLKPIATTGKEYVGQIGTGDYYTIKSGEIVTIDIPLNFDQSGTYLIEFSLSDSSGISAGMFDITARVYGSQNYWEKVIQKLQYPLILDNSGVPFSVTRSGITIPSTAQTAIPVGWLLGLLLLAALAGFLNSALFLRTKILKKDNKLGIITFGIALALTTAIFVFV